MLNPTQTTGLDALNKKITAGYTPNAKDAANLNYAKGQGYKPTDSTQPMVAGYDQTGKQVQVPKGAYVPGVSLTPKTVKSDTFDVTKDTKYQELLKKNEELLASQKTQTDANAAGTAAGTDAYSNYLNSLASDIKANIQPTFTPEQQKLNTQSLLDTQAKERTLKENYQAGVDLTGTQAGVPMSDIRGQQATIQNQYNRQAGVLSDQEANLLSAVNLSSAERTALVNGDISIASIQDKVQSHIDSAKQSVLDSAKLLTTQAQTNLASALDSLKGTTWSQLSTEQQNQLYTLAQQGGYPVSVLQAGMDAVAKQTTLDNSIKSKTANQPIQIGEDLMGNKIYGTFNQETQTWQPIATDTTVTNGLETTTTPTNATGSLSYQNNNPGNIKWTGASWQTALGGVDSGIKSQDGGTFVKFPTLEAGTNAQKQLLTSGSYANLSVDQAMKRWSNNGYGGEIVPDLANKKMNSLTPDELNTLADKMKTREGFIAPTTPNTPQDKIAQAQKEASSFGVNYDNLSGYQQQVWNSVPAQYKSYAEQIAHYKQSFSGLGMGGAKLKPIISDLVSMINPDYNENNFTAAKQLTNSVTSGDIANKKVAINNVIGHINSLITDFDKLGNSNIPAWNTISQKAAAATGNTQIQQAQASVQKEIEAITTELAKVYKTGLKGQASPTEQEIANWSKGLNSYSSPATLKGSLSTSLDLLTTVLQNIQGQVDAVPGMELPTDAKTMLTQNSQKNIQAIKNKGYDLGFIDQFVNESNAQISDSKDKTNTDPLNLNITNNSQSTDPLGLGL